MMRPFVLLLAVTMGRTSLQAQTGGGTEGGSLSPRIRYSMITASEGSDRAARNWVQAIVLWRLASDEWGRPPGSSASSHAAGETYREAGFAAERRGHHLLGGQANGLVYIAEYDPNGRRLIFQGQTFSIPARDSVLVVLIDEAADAKGTFTVAASTHLRGTLPSKAWAQHWTSGDTTFIVRPRNREEHIRALLSTSPVVRSFIQ